MEKNKRVARTRIDGAAEVPVKDALDEVELARPTRPHEHAEERPLVPHGRVDVPESVARHPRLREVRPERVRPRPPLCALEALRLSAGTGAWEAAGAHGGHAGLAGGERAWVGGGRGGAPALKDVTLGCAHGGCGCPGIFADRWLARVAVFPAGRVGHRVLESVFVGDAGEALHDGCGWPYY